MEAKGAEWLKLALNGAGDGAARQSQAHVSAWGADGETRQGIRNTEIQSLKAQIVCPKPQISGYFCVSFLSTHTVPSLLFSFFLHHKKRKTKQNKTRLSVKILLLRNE